MAVYSSL